MSYLFEQIDESSLCDKGAIEQISRWSVEYENMKSYTAIELAQHPIGVLAFNEDKDELLGHVALTEVSEIDGQRFARIGALVVNEAYQKNGVAKALIAHLLEITPTTLALLEIKKYYAYVHQGSLKPFQANGAEIVGPRFPTAPTGCNIIVSLDPKG